MAILTVLKFPDPRLRIKGKPLARVDASARTLAENMLETMYAEKGIGLAAPQVGESVRLLVIDTRPRENGRYKLDDMTELERQVTQPLVVINPVLVRGEGKTTYDEGCLSVPTYFETVSRLNYVEVKALNLQGEEFVIRTDGLLAICLQHEMDHLEGKLFIDRLSLIKSNRIKAQIKKFGYTTASGEESDDEAEESKEVPL